MPYIKHKFGKTFYTVKGKKGKTPIIFLHGGPGGAHKPDSPLFKLSKDRKVYLYDQIGGGKSSPTDKKLWTIKTFVEELEILINHWKLDEFHLMGGSWGTTLALEYYLRKKGKGIKSLVFQSPMFSAKDWQDDANKLIRKLSPKYQKIINYCHEINATDSKVYKEATFEYYANFVLRNRKRLKASNNKENKNIHGGNVYMHMWGPSEFAATGTLRKYDRTNDLKKIDVPTLFICGEHDEATPDTAIKYANQITQASFCEVKGASHSILAEKPVKMLKAISDHIDF